MHWVHEPTANSPFKKPPGEGTGPTICADVRGNLVGRVPSRGEQDLFERSANPSREGNGHGEHERSLHFLEWVGWRFMELANFLSSSLT